MLNTIRIWLEPDEEIPHFRRLKYEEVPVSLADVLNQGIHPWRIETLTHHLNEKFIEMLDAEENKLPELQQLGYSQSLSEGEVHSVYGSESLFERNLKRANLNLYFVESLAYLDLVKLARERLRTRWDKPTVCSLINCACSSFDEMRSFIKRKDKNVKLSGYADLERYDFSEILTLEDFEGYDQVLIKNGLPIRNFRSTQFLSQVTDDRGRLRLTERIRHFQVTVRDERTNPYDSLLYNCEVEANRVVFRPVLKNGQWRRVAAKRIAQTWREDSGRICFTTSIARVETMIQTKGITISFPGLDYQKGHSGSTSQAEIAKQSLILYHVGRYLTAGSSGQDIKDILRVHKVSMSGRKEELVDKLAELSVKLYKKLRPELNLFFANRRFIKVPRSQGTDSKPIPVLLEDDLGAMITALYIFRHLRGNVVIDATYENDTCELYDLARAMIKRDVTLEGAFAPVP